jgi:hypothetical protein
MIFGGKLGFFCLNQDIQDFRIFRMLFNDCLWEVDDFSGCCLMIVCGKLGFFRMLFNDCLWEVGIFQDVV